MALLHSPARVSNSEQNQDPPLPTPGDAFFKETFSHFESSRNFLQQHLPPRAQNSDWSFLRREPESFLDANLRSRFADMLFSCRLSGKPVFYYVLLEHKTVPEYWTMFYLLELILRIWRKHLDNTRYAQGKLPMIFPIVLHQGPKGWTPSVHFADYLDWPEDGREGLEKFNLNFEHILVDLSRLPWEEIKGEARLRLAMVLMKAVRENRVMELLPKVAPLFAELSPGGSALHFLQALAQYLMQTEERMNVSTIREIANKLPTEEARSQVMTLADYIREEGREEGRGEGLLIGQIINCREILGLPPLSLEELTVRPAEQLKLMLQELKMEVAGRLST
jgi:predicted transposase/invertase (TIGR01784 family)